MPPENINPVRQTDAEALSLCSQLLSETKYGSLGVIEPGTGVPLVSRIAGCWANETGFFFAASDLSVHSKCLVQNGTCSLMLGEPGKGDGLAYPRITLVGHTKRMPNDDPERNIYKTHFLKTHPKAQLYIDFADFGFYPLKLQRALLNGGFGKAYHLDKEELAGLSA